MKVSIKILYFLAVLLIIPNTAFAMHIMEGFLPIKWAIFWWLLTFPFLIIGLKKMSSLVKRNAETKLLLGLSGAFTFVLSALKIPSVTGSCSHPTGVGLGTVLFGPFVMSVLGTIVLLFQSLLISPWRFNNAWRQCVFDGDCWTFYRLWSI